MHPLGGSQVDRRLEIDAAWPCDVRTPGYLTRQPDVDVMGFGWDGLGGCMRDIEEFICRLA